MRTKNIKDRCTKRKVKKCEEIVKTYDKIQTAYADILDRNPDVKSIRYREFGCVHYIKHFLKTAIFQLAQRPPRGFSMRKAMCRKKAY